MTMRVKDFVAQLIKAIDSLPREDKNLNLLVRTESRLALKKLKLFLHKYAANENQLSRKELKEFCAFLSERWYHTKDTDACYCHHPKSIANQAHILFAKQLSQLVDEDVYTLLMPPVGAIIHKNSRAKLSDFSFHEFVLGDNGTPIEVAKCLDDAANNRSLVLYHTGNERIPLNAAETERVINHCQEARDYYEAIKYFVETGHANDVPMASKILHEILESDDCQVTASYGKAGRKRLSKAILTHIHSQKELVECMLVMCSQDWGGVFAGYE